MEMIRPSSDLRNHYSEISRTCRANRQPVYITLRQSERARRLQRPSAARWTILRMRN